MGVLLDIYMTASVFLCISLMASMVAAFGNIFRDKKENNAVYQIITFIPTKLIELLGLDFSYSRLFLSSFLIAVFVIVLNVTFIFTFG